MVVATGGYEVKQQNHIECWTHFSVECEFVARHLLLAPVKLDLCFRVKAPVSGTCTLQKWNDALELHGPHGSAAVIGLLHICW